MTKKSAAKKTKEVKKSPLGKATEVVAAILLSLGGGSLISMLTRDAMGQFSMFKQPPLAPPAWLFPVAWGILYIAMGIASYLIYNSKKSPESKMALILYIAQLVFNFGWTLIFFNLGMFWPAFVWLMVMWVLILVLIIKTREVSLNAFYLLIPYLHWCTFAAYLNAGIAILN